MKIIIMTLALSSITWLSFGVLVQMPSAEIIKKRLHAVKESADVLEHTTLMLDLADQEEEATEIAALVEKSCIAYALTIKEQQLNQFNILELYHWKLGPQIMTALLQDAPEALKELKQQGRI